MNQEEFVLTFFGGLPIPRTVTQKLLSQPQVGSNVVPEVVDRGPDVRNRASASLRDCPGDSGVLLDDVPTLIASSFEFEDDFGDRDNYLAEIGKQSTLGRSHEREV